MAGPVVLITGCTEGGIGYALCLEFAGKGCKVYATVRRARSAQGLKPLGVQVIELEVTNDESRKAAVSTVLDHEGRVDILVNNAASVGTMRPVLDERLDDVRGLFEVNLFGPMALTQLVVPSMIKNKKGLILNISSVNAYAPVPFISSYNASKAALTAMSNTLRLELRPLGINVTHVALGAVHTPLRNKAKTSLLAWPKDSVYAAGRALHIMANVFDQSGVTASTPEAVAAVLAQAALKPKPPACIWTGGSSLLVWVTTFLPLWLTDLAAASMFKLSRWMETPTAK